MVDPRTKKFAKLLVDYSLDIKKGDRFRMMGSPEAKDLVLEVYKRAIQKGAHVESRVSFEEQGYILLKYGKLPQLTDLTELDKKSFERLDAYLGIIGAANLYNTPKGEKISDKQKAMSIARQPLSEMMAKKKWSVTIFPTNAFAQEAHMPLEEFTDFVYSAVFADKKNPIAEWKKISAQQEKLVKRLNKAKHFRVKGKETDLEMSLEGMKAINCDGHYNMPDGEVFTAPVLNSVNGHILYDLPSVQNGKEVNNIRLKFKDGKVVDAKSEKGEDVLLKLLDTDEGSKYVGELGIGTNSGIKVPIKQILFDEKIGGTIHLALGRAYPETDNTNQSALHWDMIKDLREEGELYLDNKLIQKNGVWCFKY